MKKRFNMKKKFRFLTLALAMAIVTLLTIAMPAMADAPVSHTITLLSGGTTEAAGYAYDNPYYSGAEIYVSGPSTQTAGFTITDPSADPLNANSYSNGEAWPAAQIIANPNGSWATIGGASWVSTTSLNSGVENPVERDAWRLYRATFNITNLPAVTAATIQIAADNAYEFYLNGHKIASTATLDPEAPVYGLWPGNGTQVPFTHIADFNFTTPYLVAGTNTLMFVVRNWDNYGSDNPSGLIYKVTLQHAATHQQLNPAVYSGTGTWFDAPVVTVPASQWIQMITGAQWVSTTADYSGTDNDYKGDGWRLFRDQFTIPSGANITSATIQIAGDNAFELYLNGNLIASTAPVETVYGASPEPGGSMAPFENIVTYTITPQTGANTLMFVVRNWALSSGNNPTGLLYTASITYETSSVPPGIVGGTVYPIDKMQLLLPWLGAGLGAVILLSFTINRFFFRKKQVIPNR
jgi:hypothetical protein